MIRKHLRWTLTILMLMAGSSAFGANCTIKATGVNFGNYNTAVRKVVGTVTVTCTKNVSYAIALNQGLGTGATVTNRSMKSGSNVLGYGLYTDAARSINWGDSAGTNWVTGRGTGRAQKHNIYAEVPANEYSNVATYSDTITASVQGAGFKTANASFAVKANMLAHCILSAAPLVFGSYIGVVNNATTSIDVTCTNQTSYTVGLSQGKSSRATVTKRAMTGPAGTLLHYGLYSDSGHTLNWGDTAATNWVSGAGAGGKQSLTVYGQIPGGQFPRPGSYSDTIIAKITY